MVDPAKIAIIVNLPPPKSVKQLRTTLGHTGYYRKFFKGYAQITALLCPCSTALKNIISSNKILFCFDEMFEFPKENLVNHQLLKQ